MAKIYPILLAGGSGTRLWPLSRKTYPKQFSKIYGSNTLLQQLALRTVSTEKIIFQSHIAITNENYRFIISDQLNEIGIKLEHILIEPEPKNTAPAIVSVAHYLYQMDADAVMLVAPADHIISDTAEFHTAIEKGLEHAHDGKIVTFGITPSHPETGYGYLELEHQKIYAGGVQKINKFVEKPDIKTAQKMMQSGNFLWNSGIFLFRAADILANCKKLDIELHDLTALAVQNIETDLGFSRLNKSAWSRIKSISIDYAIMEKSNNIVAVPYSHHWNDLGDWAAVRAETVSDQYQNSVGANAYAHNCKETLLRSETENQYIVGLGLENIVAVATSDAVLVTTNENAQNVKQLVEILNKNGVSQGSEFTKDHRPWGWFDSLLKSDRFQVKRIYVKPSEALSLQSHHHRSEHWIVVSGTAKVTINDTEKLVTEGESVYISVGAVHRLENPGKLPLILIEVQTGAYLGEDDIVRYEDRYQRD